MKPALLAVLFLASSISSFASDAICTPGMAVEDIPIKTHNVYLTLKSALIFPAESESVFLSPEMNTEVDFLQFIARSSSESVRSLKRTLKITNIHFEHFEGDNSIEFWLTTGDDKSIKEIIGAVYSSREGGAVTVGQLETELAKGAITFNCEPKPIVEM